MLPAPWVFLLQIYQHLRTPECWMAFVDTCKRRWKLSPHVVQKNWVRNLICTVAKKDCSTTPNLHTALNLFQNVDYLSIMIYRGIKILPLCTHLFPKQFLFLLITYYLLGIKQKSKFVQIFYPVLTCVPLFLLACHKINDIFIRHLHKEWFFMLFNTASLAQLHRLGT